MLGTASGDAAFYLDACPSLSMFVWTGEYLRNAEHASDVEKPTRQRSWPCFTTFSIFRSPWRRWMPTGDNPGTVSCPSFSHTCSSVFWYVACVYVIPACARDAHVLQTLVNDVPYGCVGSLPALGVIVLASIVYAVRLVRAPDYAAKRQLRAWEVLSGARLQRAPVVTDAQVR
jgi:hypothetical protein